MNGQKYYLKIENPGEFSIEFSNVSEMAITGTYRKESIQQNLLGDLLIDRIGAEKVTINTRINLMNTTEMYRLRQARERIANEVSFDRGGIRTTKTMRIAEFEEPTPVYISPQSFPDGSVSYDIRYLTLNITLEEI